MPYLHNERRSISMAHLREAWLRDNKAAIDALVTSDVGSCTDGRKNPAQSIGKWKTWEKAFNAAGIDARYMEASTPGSSKRTWSIRAELAEYIRITAPELISTSVYERRCCRARRALPEAVKEHNRMIREMDQHHGRD